MSDSMDKLAKGIRNAIDEKNDRKPKAYDTQAEVLSKDGDILWVHIPGGVDRTPVRRTVDANEGDSVMVRVADGRAWTLGNATNPPTDDSYARRGLRDLKKATQGAVDFVGDLSDQDVTVNSIRAATGYIDDLYSKNITTENIKASTGYIHDLTAENITTEKIKAATGYIDDLTAKHITADNIEADHITVGTIDATYAKISELNAAKGRIDTLESNEVVVNDTLKAANANIDYLKSDWISTDRLVLTGNNQNNYPPVQITEAEFNVNKTAYWTKEGNNFVQCTEQSVYNEDTQYYVRQSVKAIIEAINNANRYTEVSPTQAEFNADKTNYYTYDGAEYIQCKSTDTYSPSTQYYIYDTQIIVSKDKLIAASMDVAELSAITADMGTLTAGKIEKGNNFINFNTSPASMEFKNRDSWENSTQGIQFDTQGHLNIKGTINVGPGSNVPTTDELNDAINSVQIGGRNFFGLGSKCESLDGFRVSGSWDITTEDGFKCAHTTAGLNTTKYIQSVIPFTPKPLEQVTFSAYVKAKNIVQGSTNPMDAFYFSGVQIDNVWRGCLYYDAYVDGEFVRHSGHLSGVYFSALINDSKWHHVAVTATFDDAEFSADIPPYIYVRDCTGDLYVRDIKYERGNKATDWSPAPEDIDNIQVGGRNLIRDSQIDNGIALNIPSGAAALSYGTWRREAGCSAEYISSGDYLNVASTSTSYPTSKYGIYQDVVIKPNTDYVLSAENTGACTIGYQFTGTTDAAMWPSDNGNWISANGRWHKVIRTNENTHNRCRIYIYATYSGAASRLQRIKLEQGNKATDWSPAPEDLMGMHAIHTVDCISPDNSYTYSQIIDYMSRTTALSWHVTSTAGIKIGDTVRLGITASDMGTNGTKVYLVATVTSIAEATRLYAISKGLDTTVIDGGHILTGSIDANRMSANVINAVNSSGSGKINANKINVGDIDIGSLGGTIGGRNLVTNSSNLADFLSESPSRCAVTVVADRVSIKHTEDSAKTLGAYYEIPSPEIGAKYTLSFTVESAAGSGMYSIGGAGTSNVWAGILGYASVKNGRNTATFTVPSGATSLRIYLSTNSYNQELLVSKLQLEKGSVATDWSPAPSDLLDKTHINVRNIKNESSTNVSISVSGENITFTRLGTSTGNWGGYYDIPCEPNAYYTASAKVSAGGDWVIRFGTATAVQDNVSIWSGLGAHANGAGVGGYYISSSTVPTYSNEPYIRIYFCSTVPGATWTISDITVQKGSEFANATSYITHVNNNGISIHPYSTTNDRVDINGGGMYVYKGGSLRAKYEDAVTLQSSNGTYPKMTVSSTEAYFQYNSDSWATMNSNGFVIHKDGADVGYFKGETARIGRGDRGRVDIASTGIDLYGYNSSASTPNQNLCHIGFASGTAASGTAIAPYFTFGSRTGTIGNYSVTIGNGVTASAYGALAGGGTTNSITTTASGRASIAYGYGCVASGVASMAIGEGTTASLDHQLAIGAWNVVSATGSNERFVIGIGTGPSARKNAFVVSGSGSVTCGYNLTVGNDITLSGNITMNNGKILKLNAGAGSTYSDTGIYAATALNTSNMYLSADGYLAFYVGNASNAPTGRTYIEYDVASFYQKIYANVGIELANNQALRGRNTSGTPKALIYISGSNTVNLGNADGATYVNGTSFSGSKAYTGSDLRLKHDIIPLDDRSSELIMNLKPFEYKWNEGQEHFYSKGKCFGLGAQEVSKLMDDIGYDPKDYRVVEETPDGYLAICYTELIPHLIYVVQRQQKEIEELKGVIKCTS